MKKTIQVGEYKKEYNEVLGIELKVLPIVYVKGLKEHLIKRKHYDVVKYIDNLEDILSEPDYVAVSMTSNEAIVLIKRLEKNVTVIVKLNTDGNNYYVATMYSIPNKKIDRKVYAGQYKPLTKNTKNNIICSES